MQGKAKQYGKQQYLEDISAGERANHAARDHVQQEGNNPLIFRLFSVNRHRFRIQRGRVNVHARARLYHVDNNQADNQRDGTDNLEVQQGNRPRTPDRLHAFHASDTGHHGTEDDRRDDHFDELNERVAKRFHLRAQLRVVVTEQNTDGDGCQDLEVKTFEE